MLPSYIVNFFYILWKFIVSNASPITLIVGVLTLITVYLFHANNQKNLFHSLLVDLNQIAKDSEAYKDVIVQSILREEQTSNKKNLLNYIKLNFDNYSNLSEIKEIQEEIKKDELIAVKIHKFGKEFTKKILEIHMRKKAEQDIVDYILTSPLIPHFLVHQIEYEFYSKNIDLRRHLLFGKDSSELKNRVLDLKRHISVMNFQISKLTDSSFTPYLNICKSYHELKKLTKIDKKLIPYIIPLLSRKYKVD